MKKLLMIFIVLALTMTFVACDSTGDGNQTEKPVEMTNPLNAPLLTLVLGEDAVETYGEGGVWNWKDENGRLVHSRLDSVHVLDCDVRTKIRPSGEQRRVLLAFDSLLMPTSVTVRCWEKGHPSSDAQNTAWSVTLTDPELQTDLWGGYSFELLDGSYVYEMVVVWEQDPEIFWEQYGTVHYAFETGTTD